jgi:hypothetical protein
MKFIANILFIICAIHSKVNSQKTECSYPLISEKVIIPQNNCINFSVGAGTGCEWMCSYCATNLGTNNYYFTTDVCKYESGGCVGNPQTGVTYTCCSV